MAIKRKCLGYEECKNPCNKSIKTNKKSYFRNVTQKGFANNKSFWNTIKPFFLIVSR